MVKLVMPTEDAHKDPCEQNLRLLQNRIESEFSNLVEARSEQGELDRIKSREINLIEDRIMKQYARQLVNKHELLRTNENANDSDADRYIQLDQFLNTIGLQPRTIEVLKSDVNLTVDRLFRLQMDELNSLTAANDIGETEQEKLHKSWKRLHQHYNQYEQNKKLSTASADFETTGRLNSVSSDNDRAGINQCATPLKLQPVRPALRSQSSFNGSFDRQSPPHTPLNMSGRTHLSSSSSSLLHHSISITQSPVVDNPYNYTPPRIDAEGMFQQYMPRCDSVPVKFIQGHSGAKHTRSHSVGNPLEFEEDLIETPNPRSSSASPPPNDSWHSASYVLKPHPQVRRVVDTSPSPVTTNKVETADKEQTLSNSGSFDYLRAQPVSQSRPSSRDGMLTVHGSITTSHSHDDILAVRKSTGYDSDFPIRHFSTSLSPRNEDRGAMSGPTSSSMVNLPNLIVNHENEDYDIGKASSVPRLTIYSTGGDSKESSGQHSMPTSPRTPGNYAPTGHIGHAIPHRFSNKTVLCTTRSCDYCKRSMVFGVRCQKCKYKCHKACARKAPFSCGLPPELEEFFRQRVLCNKNNTQEPSSPSLPLPDVFPIQDLNREPSQGRFSPMSDNKRRFEFSRIPTASEIDTNQNVATLNVPNSSWCHASGSTSPSLSSPLSSPSMTPRSPLSPQYHNTPLFSESFDSGNSSRKQSDSSQSRHTVDSSYRNNINHSNRNSIELCDGRSSRSQEDTEDEIYNLEDEDLSSVSCDSIEDKGQRPRGRRPPPMIVSQDELPDFVAALSPRNSLKRLLESRLDSDDRTSITPTQSIGSTIDDRNPLIGTNSSTVTISTCASTLTNGSEDCCDNGLDDSFDGIPETVRGSQRFKRQRGSIFNEWEIPFEQLEIERLIGKSDVSEVYKGKWHGKVTIKKFYLPNATKIQLNKFQLETGLLRQIRHENVALFMGACHTPPNLAIVTSYCNGNTLYQHLHIFGEKFLSTKCVNIARQVSQGMSYLHNKGIVHQNLSTRNIFLCKEVAIVCDVGLASLSEILSSYETECGRRELKIQRGRLNYLAPEILKALAPPCPLKGTTIIQYSTASDIYAFGTVMFELLTGTWPYAGYPAEVLIYKVGNGFHQTLDKIEGHKQLKTLITDCWNHHTAERKPFKKLLGTLTQTHHRKTPVTRMTSTPIGLHALGGSLEAPC